MAELIPQPIEVDAVAAGVACSVCWGMGKPFGDGDTPESITISLSGINKGPNWVSGDAEPLSGDFVLNQVGGLPCKFALVDPPNGFQVEFRSTETEVFVEELGVSIFFSAVAAAACSVLIFNDENDVYTGGSCKIIIPEVT